jgi:hypothetical protein
MKILKAELIQPGISPNEPIATIGVFPGDISNITKVVELFLTNNTDTTEAFDNYVKEQVTNYVNTYQPVAIKKENNFITLLLKKQDD